MFIIIHYSSRVFPLYPSPSPPQIQHHTFSIIKLLLLTTSRLTSIVYMSGFPANRCTDAQLRSGQVHGCATPRCMDVQRPGVRMFNDQTHRCPTAKRKDVQPPSGQVHGFPTARDADVQQTDAPWLMPNCPAAKCMDTKHPGARMSNGQGQG